MKTRRRRFRYARAIRGISLLEMLIALVLLAVAGAPVLDLLTQSRRLSVMASHQVTASAEAQTLLEGVAALEPSDLPSGAASPAPAPILADGGPNGAGGSAKWSELVKLFGERSRPEMKRTVETAAMGAGRILVRVKVRYVKLVTAKEPAREIALVGLSVNRR